MIERGVIDACCLLNLLASDRAEEILRATATTWLVADVVAQETLHVYKPDPDDPARLTPFKADLSLFQTGLLVIEPVQPYLGDFVRLANQLGDGEAATLAIALQNGLPAATDDRRARRFAADEGIKLTSTPEILSHWASTVSTPQEEVRETLQRIEARASYKPKANVAGATWWISIVGAQ